MAAIRKSGGVVPFFWQGKLVDPRNDEFSEHLSLQRFRTIENAASEEVSIGWVTPADPTGDNFSPEDLDGGIGTWLRFRIDKKSMPMKWLQIHRDAAEKARGKKLSAKERRELKDDLMDQLLPRVLPTITLVDALLFEERKTVLLFATSKAAKEVRGAPATAVSPGFVCLKCTATRSPTSTSVSESRDEVAFSGEVSQNICSTRKTMSP